MGKNHYTILGGEYQYQQLYKKNASITGKHRPVNIESKQPKCCFKNIPIIQHDTLFATAFINKSQCNLRSARHEKIIHCQNITTAHFCFDKKIEERGHVLERGRAVMEGKAAGLIDDPLVKEAYLGI
jgi:hypothetical protein